VFERGTPDEDPLVVNTTAVAGGGESGESGWLFSRPCLGLVGNWLREGSDGKVGNEGSVGIRRAGADGLVMADSLLTEVLVVRPVANVVVAPDTAAGVVGDTGVGFVNDTAAAEEEFGTAPEDVPESVTPNLGKEGKRGMLLREDERLMAAIELELPGSPDELVIRLADGTGTVVVILVVGAMEAGKVGSRGNSNRGTEGVRTTGVGVAVAEGVADGVAVPAGVGDATEIGDVGEDGLTAAELSRVATTGMVTGESRGTVGI
jgi:hypothetical protein